MRLFVLITALRNMHRQPSPLLQAGMHPGHPGPPPPHAHPQQQPAAAATAPVVAQSAQSMYQKRRRTNAIQIVNPNTGEVTECRIRGGGKTAKR